mmetsp:Transcript_1561/g.4974  ORF Transcript_1561/g.4974 Transcript_1561/m.4974 type:complete len:256 (+) Transcript_1561:159-926(+)
MLRVAVAQSRWRPYDVNVMEAAPSMGEMFMSTAPFGPSGPAASLHVATNNAPFLSEGTMELAKGHVQGHHHDKAEQHALCGEHAVAVGVHLRDERIRHHMDHGPSRARHGERQDGAAVRDKEGPDEPGDGLHHAGHLAVEEGRLERRALAVERKGDCEALREVLDADAQGEGDGAPEARRRLGARLAPQRSEGNAHGEALRRVVRGDGDDELEHAPHTELRVLRALGALGGLEPWEPALGARLGGLWRGGQGRLV